MFERRTDLIRFLAVADAERIVGAAEDMAPFRMLEEAVRDAALGRRIGSPG